MRTGTLVCLSLLSLFGLPDSSSAQAIIEAVRAGDEAAVGLIMEGDPEAVNARDDRQRTPLHHAAQRGHEEIVELLLFRGADPDLQDYGGHTPLHRAATYGAAGAIDILLQYDSALDLRDDYGRTPLLLVARESGSAEAARTLLEHGADPDALDRFGASSLNLAAWRGFAGVVDALLDHSAALEADGERAVATTEFAAHA